MTIPAPTPHPLLPDPVAPQLYIERLSDGLTAEGPFRDEVEASGFMDTQGWGDQTHKLVWRVPPAECETCGGLSHRFPGIREASNTVQGIERCDECLRYPGDLEAAAALAALVPGAVVAFEFVVTNKASTVESAAWLQRMNVRGDWTVVWDGKDLPAGVYLAHETDPWIEVDGTPIDWTTFEVPAPTPADPLSPRERLRANLDRLLNN